MINYILSCSTTEDLTADHLKDLDIQYCRFPFRIGNEDFIDDLGITLPYPEFYKRMREGQDTKTSQINPEGYKEYFRPFLKDGKDVLHYQVSSGITGAMNSLMIAVNELKEEFPDRTIAVVDSLGCSSGNGLMMDTLGRMRLNGTSFEDLHKFAEENKLKVHHLFFSFDLHWYVKGGRISKIAGAIGGALQICPLLHMPKEGTLTLIKKVRTKEAVMKAMVDEMETLVENGLDYDKKVYISQSDCMEDAMAVKKMIEERFKKLQEPVLINYVGTTVGSHTGPGTVALFFWGQENRQ